jgi:hypothetical protein
MSVSSTLRGISLSQPKLDRKSMASAASLQASALACDCSSMVRYCKRSQRTVNIQPQARQEVRQLAQSARAAAAAAADAGAAVLRQEQQVGELTRALSRLRHARASAAVAEERQLLQDRLEQVQGGG